MSPKEKKTAPVPKFLFGEDFGSPHSWLWVNHTHYPRFIARIRDTAQGSITLRVHPLNELDSTFAARPGSEALERSAARSFLLHVDGRKLGPTEEIKWEALKASAIPAQILLEDARALHSFALNVTPRKVLAEIHRGALKVIECPEKVARNLLRLNSRTVLAEMTRGKIRIIVSPAQMQPETLEAIKMKFAALFKAAKASLKVANKNPPIPRKAKRSRAGPNT